MTDTLTPPTGGARPSPRTTGERRRDGAWFCAFVTTAGAALILVALVVGVLTGLRVSGAQNHELTAAVDGVRAVAVDFSAADVDVEYGDVDEATLSVTSGGWSTDVDPSMTVTDGMLRVTDGDGWFFLPTFGGWSDRSRATLTLPRSLEGTIDLDTEISAGSIGVTGDFRSVQLRMSAGQTRFTGASTELAADVSAGKLVVDTDGPRTVSLTASAGEIRASVTGEQPATTDVEISAGSATLALPRGSYAVTGDASAGSRAIDVRTDPTAGARLHVSVSAGSARVGYSD